MDEGSACAHSRYAEAPAPGNGRQKSRCPAPGLGTLPQYGDSNTSVRPSPIRCHLPFPVRRGLLAGWSLYGPGRAWSFVLPPGPATIAEVENHRALSFSQEALWFLTQLQPDSPFYNMPLGYRLRGRLVVDALGRALADVITRHAVLRSNLIERDGGPV